MTLLSGVLGGVVSNKSDEHSATIVFDRVQVWPKLSLTADFERTARLLSPHKYRLQLRTGHIYHPPEPPEPDIGYPGDPEGHFENVTKAFIYWTEKPYASPYEVAEWGPEGVQQFRREQAKKWHLFAGTMYANRSFTMLRDVIEGKPVCYERYTAFPDQYDLTTTLTPRDKAKALVWLDQQLERGFIKP